MDLPHSTLHYYLSEIICNAILTPSQSQRSPTSLENGQAQVVLSFSEPSSPDRHCASEIHVADLLIPSTIRTENGFTLLYIMMLY